MANRRDRLHKLLDLARAYRGWSRVQLARALGRDTTRLYTETDDPKFGFVVALADVLEWPMDAVADFLWTGDEGSEAALEVPKEYADLSFAELYPQAQQAYKQGDYVEAVRMSKWLRARATSAKDRAEAFNIEYLGWDGLGRYTKAASAIRQASLQTPIDTHLRFVLQTNLANTHYTLWDLPAAIGICGSIIDWYEVHPPESYKHSICLAYARYVRGNAHRRSVAIEPDRTADHCKIAMEDLSEAKESLDRLAHELSREDLRGTAHTCEGGILESEVHLGLRSPQEALGMVMERLEGATNPEEIPPGNWLESFGWWCVFGGNIALKYLKGPSLQRPMAVFINKALEIGERSGNWAFRERVLTMEHLLRESLTDSTGYMLETIIDEEDIRLITGAMGRFPNFQRLGWEILRSAKVEHHGRRQ